MCLLLTFLCATFRQILFYCTHGEEPLEGETPTWGELEKTRRGGHLLLGRCFSVGASQNVLTDDKGNKLFSFVVLGGQARHILWADSEEERNAWVKDIQAVVGEHLDAAMPSKSRAAGSPVAVHDHHFWDTVLWELRAHHQVELEDQKDGGRSTTGLVCSGTQVLQILPGSPADQEVKCLHTNETISLQVGDEILDVNGKTVLPDDCNEKLRGVCTCVCARTISCVCVCVRLCVCL